MRDRLQRRKKKPEDASDQPAPPPLQPAYFDAEQEPGSTSASGAVESEMPEPAQPVSDAPPFQSARARSEEEPSDAQPTSSQPAPRGPGPANRGRRRRGGRGRGGRGREQAVAQAFTPAVAKGIIPVQPGQLVEEGAEEGAPEI